MKKPKASEALVKLKFWYWPVARRLWFVSRHFKRASLFSIKVSFIFYNVSLYRLTNSFLFWVICLSSVKSFVNEKLLVSFFEKHQPFGNNNILSIISWNYYSQSLHENLVFILFYLPIRIVYFRKFCHCRMNNEQVLLHLKIMVDLCF